MNQLINACTAARNPAVFVAFLLVFMAVAITPSRATTIVPMDVNDLVGLSRAVVIVTIEGKQSRWNDTHDEIFTEYRVEVERALKDPTYRLETLRALGGTVADKTLRVEGIPRFNVGDRAVLFVDSDESGLFPVVGWQAGVYRIIEASGREAVFTHDWRPVVGLADGAAVVGALPTTQGEEGSGADRDHQVMQAASVAGTCIVLDAFLREVDGIIADQKARGFTWRYAHLLNPQRHLQTPADAGRPIVVTDPALPSPRDEE